MKKIKATAAILTVLMAGGICAPTAYTGVSVEAAEVMAAPEFIYHTAKTKTSITLTWGKVSGADAYGIYKYDASKKKFVLYKAVKGTSCTVKGLTAGKAYSFKVCALRKSSGKYYAGKKSEMYRTRTAFNFKPGDTVSCDMFSITVPAGCAYAAETEKDSISLYDKEAHATEYGGWAFDLALYESPADYYGMMDKKIGEIRTDSTVYDVVAAYPSEIQYDYQKYPDLMPRSYDMLYSGADDIFKTVKAKEGTFVYGGATGDELYGDVLTKYKKALSENWDSNKLEENDMSAAYYQIYSSDKCDMTERIGYAFRDVNNDGTPELLIGDITEDESVIFDIYTTVDRKPAHVASGWYRNRYYVYEYGICNEYSESAFASGFRIYDLMHNTTEFTPSVDFRYDGEKDEAQPYFIAYSDGEYEQVSEEDFEQRKSNFGDKLHIDFTPFSSVK